MQFGGFWAELRFLFKAWFKMKFNNNEMALIVFAFSTHL